MYVFPTTEAYCTKYTLIDIVTGVYLASTLMDEESFKRGQDTKETVTGTNTFVKHWRSFLKRHTNGMCTWQDICGVNQQCTSQYFNAPSTGESHQKMKRGGQFGLYFRLFQKKRTKCCCKTVCPRRYKRLFWMSCAQSYEAADAAARWNIVNLFCRPKRCITRGRNTMTWL
ncbi:hypothetical protein CHS0354_031123 [Potamilus streckersoni]|uniref:Uncharacterized protein n=1 Tax=Potamilus streckersoni TaxID=2493646 RepID=A0AAE0WBI2_9BIVA|nr:hypothetical protein CHS0354_031123 [Potamilus streckersoni]